MTTHLAMPNMSQMYGTTTAAYSYEPEKPITAYNFEDLSGFVDMPVSPKQANNTTTVVGPSMKANVKSAEKVQPVSYEKLPSGEEKRTVFNPAAPSFKPAGGYLKFDVLIPNRIFVGGISSDTTEADLRNVFSAYGNVRGTKIINDHCGVNKGYGFVTFATAEEAQRLQTDGLCVFLRDRKLSIGPAIRKQLVPKLPPGMAKDASYEHLMKAISIKRGGNSYGTATDAATAPSHDILAYYPKWSLNAN